MFYLYIAVYSQRFDIVHIHSCWLSSFFIRKPKLIEFHGDDIRKSPSRKWKIDKLVTNWFIKYYKNKIKFLTSTPDLLKDLPDAEYLPNPVDVEHFKPSTQIIENTAIFFDNWHEAYSTRIEKLKQRLLVATVATVDRNRKEHFGYNALPQNLSIFEYFIDRGGIYSLSKTALEALAMGLKVIRWDDKIIQGLPSEHLPENVAKKTIEIYGEIIKQ